MKNVLIVDNEKDFLHHFTEGLSDYQEIFSVITTEGNKDAIEILNEMPIDLVIIDFKMSSTDDFGLLSYINLNFPAITIIIMSTYKIYSKSKIVKELDSIGIYT